MNIDSGGIRDSGGQLSEPLSEKESGTYKCSFCPSVFPTLYHLQCHNVYKHSSILSNGHRGDLPSEFQNRQLAEVRYGSYALDLKSSVTYQSHNVAQNEKIPISESGALDLSTVRCRNTQEPKPECIKVSSTIDNEAEDSDNEESDKLVIDTQIESEITPEKSSDSPRRQCSPNRWSNSPLSQSRDFLNKNSNHNVHSHSNSTIHNSQYLSHYPDSGDVRDRKTFEEKTPSSEYLGLDNRSVSPVRNNSQQPDNTKPSETFNYSSSFLNRAPESKFPSLDNQSLLSMIPPLPHIGMMGNFPMPFGFSPFMMIPPNSFMQPPIVGNVAENRFSLPSMPSDTYSSALPYNPNLNLQPSKPGPVRKSSENKSRSSSKNGNSGKTKDVVEIYDCKTCNRRFTQVGNFHNHMKTHESKICACGICSMEFGDSYELQRHMRNTHTGSMPYKCDECDREFSQYNNLRRHLRVHNGKNYKCHLCGRTFNEVFYLEMHMGSHTGERTYKCGVCNASYSDNAELQKHVSTHSAEELHTCNVCGKSFSKACVLRQHKKMHSGVRPFKCEVCDKSFIHRHHLTIHARMHSTNKPYTCKICKKDFAQTSHLYKHIRQHTEQPGVTEEMIHESLAPILEKLKKSKDSLDTSTQNDANEEKLTDAINNNNIKRETSLENATKLHHEEPVNFKNREQDKNCEDSSFQKEAQSDEESTAVDNRSSPPLMNVKQILGGGLKEMEHLMNEHGNRKRLGSFGKDHDLESLHDSSESDDNASDKTGVSYASSVSEKRFLNSPPAVIPYNEQCLQERPYPRIPSYVPGQSRETDFTKKDGDCANKYNLNNETSQKTIKKEDSSKYENNDRYSPISQSGDSLSEGDFRSRSNSACENLRPVYSSSNSTVSPRVVSSDSILKEQPIPMDNYETKTEIVMPLKKRRRYTPRQKKKSQDLSEEQQPTYQQMIQPMSAEAQQIYFIQLQQMQMALAANVMAAQGMMLQRGSDVSKNLHTENLRNIPNGYSHNSDIKDPVMRQSLFGTPLKGSIPYPSLTKDGDLQDMSRGSPLQNGSLINHSVTRASYL